MTAAVTAVSALECFRVSLRLGLTSFGGPVAHLGYFEQLYVRQKNWLTAEEYASLVALCQALPGPASSQVNFLIGLQRAGFAGALLSFIGFTLPSALLMLAAVQAMTFAAPPDALLHGLKLAAAVIVAQAVWSMAPKLCPDGTRRILAGIVFAVTLMFGGISTQLGVLVFGALGGMWLCRGAVLPQGMAAAVVTPRAALRCLLVFALLLVALPFMTGGLQSGTPMALADTFYRAGALVFGGGHVVLPLLYETSGLGSGTFMTIYGAAQVLPGPLFAIAAGLGAAILPQAPMTGGALALGFIFLPGFLVAIAGFHYWQTLSALPRAAGALAGVNAAVVGLLASALIHPVLSSAFMSFYDLGFILTAFIILQKFKLPPLPVVLAAVCYAFVAGGM